MSRVAQYYLTGRELRPDGTVEELSPHEYGALVLRVLSIWMTSFRQAMWLGRAVLREHLYENRQAELSALNQATVAQRARGSRFDGYEFIKDPRQAGNCGGSTPKGDGRPFAEWNTEDDDDPGIPAARRSG